MKITVWLITGLSIALPLFGQWNAADKNEKLVLQTPGLKLVRMNQDTLLKAAADEAMRKWKGELSEQSFAKLKNAAPADEEVQKRFPKSISPYARIKGVDPNQKVYVAASLKGNDWKSVRGLFSYCPFCGAENYSTRFDAKNPDKAVTGCCKTELYRTGYPADYRFKPNAYASFRYLDDSIRKIPCTIYKDKDGNEWELFIHHIFDNAYWVKAANDLVGYMNRYKETGNPLYPYKAALILDHAADTYYALPLAFSNLFAKGKDGLELSRAEWENVRRPVVFQHNELGPWNRRRPFSAGDKGWINMHKEAIWCEPFALMRHHPAFKYYSKMKYGSEDALEKKVIRKLMREIILTYKACFSQRLMTNYQEANYKDLLIAGILAQDHFIVDFAAANQELTLYNHHYQDGLNGEGAQNYMAMLNSYYYPYMNDPRGYSLLNPDFRKDNPFFARAMAAWKQLFTTRGVFLEFGDQHQFIQYDFPLKGKYEHLKAKYEETPSMNFPGYGVGILRLGGKDQRLEASLHYSRATLHNASDMLGMSVWFDGVPVIRTGGYCSYWRIATGKEVDLLNQMNFPRKVLKAPRTGDSFPWLISHSPVEQNTVTVNDLPSGQGWGYNRGSSELVTFKGGEKYSDPEKSFQVLEARALGEFEKYQPGTVKEFRRALLGVETPDQRAYLVDILTIHGGKNHTQYYSSWGERTAGPEPKGTTSPSLTQAWFNGNKPKINHPNASVRWWISRFLQCFDHVREVRELTFSGQPWTIQWNADYYAYRRDADGKWDPLRSAGSRKGKAAIRMTGVPLDDTPTTLWHGLAPWSPALNRQPLRNGRFSSYLTAPFENAMDISIQRRTSGKPGLESRFVNVFEGLYPDSKPVVAGVKKVLANRDQTALEIRLADQYRDLVIWQQKNRRIELDDGISTDAMYALVRKDPDGKIVKTHMVRGTYLKKNSKDLLKQPVPQLTGTIADIFGDITGDRTRSEMEIVPDQTWDPKTLPGQILYIATTREDGHRPVTECYTIESAQRLKNGRIRLKFAFTAPFIAGWHQVIEFDPKSPNVLRTNRPMIKYANQPWYEGAKVLFPARGKTYVIKATEDSRGGSGGTFLTLRPGSDPAGDGIRSGDWYIIYSIEAGQKVSIPLSASSASR